MPPPYRSPHWKIFSAIPHRSAGPVGSPPATWATSHALSGVPAPHSVPLPTHKLDRSDVRRICLNPANPVLFGFVCAMAWGGMGSGPGGRRNVAAAWTARVKLGSHLNLLRTGGLSRCEAYRLFLGTGAIPGIGPAFFTKLIYFFSPTPDFYILDQWTAKSVNLLTGNWVVRMSGNAVSNLNKCGNHLAYCHEVDEIACLLKVTGEQAEEMMMSKGGRHPWLWRAYMRANWPAHAPSARYSASFMHSIYAGISGGPLCTKIGPACF